MMDGNDTGGRGGVTIRRGRGSAAWLTMAMAALACGGLRTTPQTTALAWPADRPRVRLEQVYPLAGNLAGGGRRVLAAVTGSSGSSALFARPYAVAWDGDDLLLADPDAGRVARLKPGGRLVLSPRGAVARPIGIAACPRGVVVTDSHAGTVTLLDPDLDRPRLLAEALERPTGVACAGRKVVLAETGRHRLMVLDDDGGVTTLGQRGDGPLAFNFPTSLAWDGGVLWVGDALNFRVQAIDLATGRVARSFGRLGDAPGDMPRIKGLAVDRAGDLWVADAHLDRLSLYDPTGRLLLTLGGTGAAPGTFAFPAGIAAHADGRVAVVDSLNRRIQVFARLPSAEGSS